MSLTFEQQLGFRINRSRTNNLSLNQRYFVWTRPESVHVCFMIVKGDIIPTVLQQRSNSMPPKSSRFEAYEAQNLE